MKIKLVIAVMLLGSFAARAQDTTDVFIRHLQLNSAIVTGLTGESKLSETPSPVTILDAGLFATASKAMDKLP